MTRSAVPITRIAASAYTIPTDAPESDGTLATTLVLVEAQAGGVTGIGYSYANRATAVLVGDTLAHVVEGRDAFDIARTWQAMVARPPTSAGRASRRWRSLPWTARCGT